MADQATMNNGRKPAEYAGRAAVKHLGNLGHDITSLAELQLKLAAADARETGRRAALPLGLLLAAAAVALGCVPVLLFALAAALQQAGLSSPVALALSALVGLAVAGTLGWLGWSLIGSSFVSFERSKEELTRNLQWVKNALASRGDGKPPGRR